MAYRMGLFGAGKERTSVAWPSEHRTMSPMSPAAAGVPAARGLVNPAPRAGPDVWADVSVGHAGAQARLKLATGARHAYLVQNKIVVPASHRRARGGSRISPTDF